MLWLRNEFLPPFVAEVLLLLQLTLSGGIYFPSHNLKRPILLWKMMPAHLTGTLWGNRGAARPLAPTWSITIPQAAVGHRHFSLPRAQQRTSVNSGGSWEIQEPSDCLDSESLTWQLQNHLGLDFALISGSFKHSVCLPNAFPIKVI